MQPGDRAQLCLLAQDRASATAAGPLVLWPPLPAAAQPWNLWPGAATWASRRGQDGHVRSEDSSGQCQGPEEAAEKVQVSASEQSNLETLVATRRPTEWASDWILRVPPSPESEGGHTRVQAALTRQLHKSNE